MAKSGDEVLGQFTQAAEQEEKSSERRYKIGIIGTGWIAEAHLQSYLACPDVDVVALADLIPGKAEKFAKKFDLDLSKIHFYPDHKALLEGEKDLDGVSICTYNVTHAECTIAALSAGVNVLLEKPMCVTTEEAAEIMRAEKKSGKALTIGFQPHGLTSMISPRLLSGWRATSFLISEFHGRCIWIRPETR